jgi:AcrR family transcriptional regulator
MLIKCNFKYGEKGISMKSIDRRIIRTKKLLRDALTSLMEEKEFERISVSDLTDRADINRGTFYIHYRDKYDLLKQSEDEMIAEIETILKEKEQINFKSAMEYIERNEPLPHIFTLVNSLLGNKEFVKAILRPSSGSTFREKLRGVIKRHILENVGKRVKTEEMIVPIDYLIAYVSSANLGVIIHWLENDEDKSPHDLAVILSKVTILGPGYVVGLKEK